MKHTLLQDSQGTSPSVVMDDVFPEGIVDMAFAAEARTLLIATGAGTLTLLRQDGVLLQANRTMVGVRSVVWADNGNFGAALVGPNKVVCIDSTLQPLWDVKVTGSVRTLAITPYGSHLAVCADSGRNHIVTTDREQIAKFDTTRPLGFVQFLSEKPRLVGAAEFGHLCCHELDGTEVWNQRITNNVGGMSVTGCGRRILLASHNQGIQMLTGRGNQKGAFMVDGVPTEVLASQDRKRIVALTQESRLYRLNFDGELQWAADLTADSPQSVCMDAFGNRLFVSTQSGRLLQLKW